MTILRTSLILLILTCSFGCDRMTKQLAQEKLPSVEAVGLFHDTIILRYAENRGAAMSFGADFSRNVRLTLFVGMAALMLFALLGLILWQRSLSMTALIGLSLIVGGGMGNLVDRIVNHGRVIDFILIRVGSFQTAIFNGADCAITLGVILLALSIIIKPDPSPATH